MDGMTVIFGAPRRTVVFPIKARDINPQLGADLSALGNFSAALNRLLAAQFSGAGTFGAGLNQDQLLGTALSAVGALTGDIFQQWWPSGSALSIDFSGQRAAANDVPIDFASQFSCVRASLGWAENIAGTLSEFAIDTARITDLGLLIEDAATAYYPYSNDVGQNGGSTLETDLGDAVGVQGGWRIASQGADWHALSGPYIDITPPEQIIFRAWVKAGSSPQMSFKVNSKDGGGATVTYSEALFYPSDWHTGGYGSFISKAHTALGNGLHLIEAIYQSQSPEASLYIGGFGPASNNAGDYFDCYGIDVQKGAATSFIVTAASAGTRAADALSIALADGTYDLTYTFDDDSQQVVAGVPVSGGAGYTLPLTLNRPWVKQIDAFAA